MQTYKLLLSSHDQKALEETLEAFQLACEVAMCAGKELGTTGNALIHRACYEKIREELGLGANLSIRAIAIAARALKENTTLDTSVIEYDSRTISIDSSHHRISLSSLHGRLRWIGVDRKPLCLDGAYRVRREPAGGFILEVE